MIPKKKKKNSKKKKLVNQRLSKSPRQNITSQKRKKSSQRAQNKRINIKNLAKMHKTQSKTKTNPRYNKCKIIYSKEKQLL